MCRTASVVLSSARFRGMCKFYLCVLGIGDVSTHTRCLVFDQCVGVVLYETRREVFVFVRFAHEYHRFR